MSKTNSIRKIDLTTEASPALVLLGSSVSTYKLTGTRVLTNNFEITPSGTPNEGMFVAMDYTGSITPGVGPYTFKIFNTEVPSSWMVRKLKIWCEFTNGAWSVYILPSLDVHGSIGLQMIDTGIVDNTTLGVSGSTGQFIIKVGGVAALQLATNAVETAKINAKAVSLDKMADLARGSIIVGNAAGVPAALNTKTAGYIIIGDGTDVKSIAVTGDIAISAAGVTAIGGGKVVADMIAAMAVGDSHISSTAGIAFSKMVALTISKIPELNSSGFIVAGSVNAAKLAYIDITTPGTAQVSKSVVLDASKKIDVMDITSLKINGTTITPTPAQINYLVNVTSDVQTQLSRAVARGITTLAVGTYSPTNATLQGIYMADTSGGAVILQLPLSNTVPAGTSVRLVRVGAAAASAIPTGSDYVYAITSLSGGLATLSCSATGKSMVLTTDGISKWQCVSYE